MPKRSPKIPKRPCKLHSAIVAMVQESGHSLSEIAAETGIDPSCLSRFITLKRSLSLESLDTLLEFLGLAVGNTRCNCGRSTSSQLRNLPPPR